MRKTAVVVPVYNPEPGLVPLCVSLCRLFPVVIVVDDGSVENRGDFQKLPPSVVQLRHAKNRGKGCAIKTALAWLVDHGSDLCGAVFVDGDGQHRPEDAFSVAAKSADKNAVTLGVRDFSRGDIPFRSRFGNILTSWLVRLFFGFPIKDTQTGLRCYPSRLWPSLLLVPGERYEYEMRLFGFLHKYREPLEMNPIETIYMEGNRASHFSPIVDSVKIYRGLFGDVSFARFASFVLSSVTSFGVDIGVFCLLFDVVLGEGVRGRLFWSVVVARCISLVYNFMLNRYWVFRLERAERSTLGGSFSRYLLLAAFIMMCSYAFTDLLASFFNCGKGVLIKMIVDGGLFLASYVIQQRIVFMKRARGL